MRHSCEMGSQRQWIVPGSLQGPSLRGRDILFPSLGAAKLPTQELTKLFLPKVLSLGSHYSNEHHCNLEMASYTANLEMLNDSTQNIGGCWPARLLLPLNSLPRSRTASVFLPIPLLSVA